MYSKLGSDTIMAVLLQIYTCVKTNCMEMSIGIANSKVRKQAGMMHLYHYRKKICVNEVHVANFNDIPQIGSTVYASFGRLGQFAVQLEGCEFFQWF